MIKGTYVLMLLLLFSGISGFSQDLTPKVLVSAAGLSTAGVIEYSQTIGETAVETFSSAGFILTQGFQQPRIQIIAGTPPEGNGVDVYPNPATDFIFVKLYGDMARKFNIEIINITGMIVNSVNVDFTEKYYYIQQIGVASLKFGFYFVRVTSDDGTIKRVFKIEKM
ncbi:MAG: T9SS type A sorting domain-containing protein [Bacteroidales bacterium]